MQVSEVTVVETLWALPLLPVCVGGGRLVKVMATGVPDDGDGGDGSFDRADASCCRFVSVSGGRLEEASAMEVGRWRRRSVLSVSVEAD